MEFLKTTQIEAGTGPYFQRYYGSKILGTGILIEKQ